MKRIVVAMMLALSGTAAIAAEPVTIRKLVEHYYPYYFKYIGPKEATGEAPMMSSEQFTLWLKEAGEDDKAVQRTLALRNARLEVASAFDFIFGPLERKTRVEDMANLLLKLSEASKQFQLHTGVPPQSMTDLWQNPGLDHWAGPYLKAELVKPFFKRFQYLELRIGMASEMEGTPPPLCPEPACISWAWLSATGLPLAYSAALDRWMDTDETPAAGQVRLVDGGFMFSLMRTNK